MKHERLVLDAMAAAARGFAEVGSYEHDGLWLYTREVAAGDAAAGGGFGSSGCSSASEQPSRCQ